MNKILSYLRKKDLYLFIARYLLAGEMIGYGLLKVVGVQAVFVFPFAGWQHPLEEATGSQLTCLGVHRLYSLVYHYYGFVRIFAGHTSIIQAYNPLRGHFIVSHDLRCVSCKSGIRSLAVYKVANGRLAFIELHYFFVRMAKD